MYKRLSQYLSHTTNWLHYMASSRALYAVHLDETSQINCLNEVFLFITANDEDTPVAQAYDSPLEEY